MKYHLIEEDGLFLIKISGETRKNEAVVAKRRLTPYLKERGIRVIIDLRNSTSCEPIVLLGVLNGIRKEVALLGGCLKLCSLKPEIRDYLKENRLDQAFQIYEDEESARKSEWRHYGKR
jgi:anti-anti-sigma factor